MAPGGKAQRLKYCTHCRHMLPRKTALAHMQKHGSSSTQQSLALPSTPAQVLASSAMPYSTDIGRRQPSLAARHFQHLAEQEKHLSSRSDVMSQPTTSARNANNDISMQDLNTDHGFDDDARSDIGGFNTNEPDTDTSTADRPPDYDPQATLLRNLLRRAAPPIIDLDSSESELDDDAEDLEERHGEEPLLSSRMARETQLEDDPEPEWDRYIENVLTAADRVEEAALRASADLGTTLSELDLKICRAFAFKHRAGLTDDDFAMIPHAFPDGPPIPSLDKVYSRIALISGVQPEVYHCCINSCMCFTGPHAELTECRHCKEPRYDQYKKARKVFVYIPIAPRLQALAGSPEMAKKMQYRAQFERDPTVVRDVFDRDQYQDLCRRRVHSGCQLAHKYFEDNRDVALGLSTDGFAPFKKRKLTAWPLIVFNYNLGPEERFHADHILSLGVIPGPSKPHDPDSFLWPFLQELGRLAVGIKTFDILTRSLFLLHAYLILVFGDIPAISMLMHMKGHNGYSPCRMCNITGIAIPNCPQKKTLYVPHQRSNFPSHPPGTPSSYDPGKLPMRTHDELIRQALAVQNARTKTESEELAKKSGIKGIPSLAFIDSLTFPTSFPYDFMHLIWENLMKNLVLLWADDFKGLDTGTEDYKLAKEVWEDIGLATEHSGETIPSAFGCKCPNIARDRSYYSAEMWAFWTLYLAPVLLRGRFKNEKYYSHFLDLAVLLRICLEFEMSSDNIEVLRKGFIAWVETYEKFYYQNNPNRASACPVTIHALLHIADSIAKFGPVWCYWAFAMERYCGRLQPAIRSRRFPFRSLDRHVTEVAQLNQIKLKYRVHQELSLSTPVSAGRITNPGVRLGASFHNSYSTCALLPPNKPYSPPEGILRAVVASFVTRFEVGRFKPTLNTVRKYVLPKNGAVWEIWGKVRRIDSEAGDTMHANEVITKPADYRDATFVQYAVYIDTNARHATYDPEFEGQNCYGRLEYIITVELPDTEAMRRDLQRSVKSRDDPQYQTKFIWAAIRSCNTEPPTSQVDRKLKELGISYYSQTGQLDIVDITCIQNLVGRLAVPGQTNRWAILDRSGSLASAVFEESTSNGSASG